MKTVTVRPGTLYRGCDAAWLRGALSGQIAGPYNCASDRELAQGYGQGVVAVLETVRPLRVRQEPIADRTPDVASYDARMDGVDGWRWEVGGAWHYRLKPGAARVVGVAACGTDVRAQSGAVLRAARAWRGWRQADMAKALGTTQPKVALYESGGASPSFERLLTAAAMLPVAVTMDAAPGAVIRAA